MHKEIDVIPSSFFRVKNIPKLRFSEDNSEKGNENDFQFFNHHKNILDKDSTESKIKIDQNPEKDIITKVQKNIA